MTKNPSVDLLKGALIILVMAGHAMELTQQHHLALWVGAGFRMPLMIGISGYLLNVTRTRNDPPERMFGRYGSRMLLPWAVALLVYILVSGWSISWTLPIDLLLRPPFHLWYVPVLFFLILVTRLVPLSPLLLLAIGTRVSLATMYSFGLNHGVTGVTLLSPDSRFLRYPVYFFFGMLMAERGLPTRYLGVTLLLSALGMGWWSALYGSENGLAFVPARLLMCLGLIALLPQLSAVRLSFAPLNAVGRDSLFFYLWHPLAMAAVMLAGVGPLPMLALSILLLAIASRLAARNALAQRLVGSAMPSRSASAPMGQAPAPASA
ncbi:MAG: acyltransferase [Sphingobium sp.]|uniref:acyltransferase family protein n=1 Tax=Sphingobium sp. TaxID=1912891 RepID=UPI000C53A313|nr:acyltransferase [Sphingobium sp.]MBU0657861.1 acyltransferase [Alphaproteobacteria bacterium]MBA4756057.1 acyltransferase [Sphingobium sp.]MBS89733.1 acetyltransferase [Sphingobium sp.]MBU0775810.1 acyltransferase [Alphaproteobacteria bacterium]MBU0868868.1 acyltransferase [Alphaproteobacteria bacterium]